MTTHFTTENRNQRFLLRKLVLEFLQTKMRKWFWIQAIYHEYIWYRETFQLNDTQTFMEKSCIILVYVTADSSVKLWFPLIQYINLQDKTARQWPWINAAGHQWWEESQPGDIVACREWQTISQTLIVAECHVDWRTYSGIEITIIIINDSWNYMKTHAHTNCI